jgi:predicted ATPase
MILQPAPDCRSQPLTIRLFGAFTATRNDSPLPRTRSRKEQWLLALLTLRHGQALDRDWLAGIFWPDALNAGALANLRRSLHDLRRVLGCDAFRLNAPTSRTVSLDLSGTSVDVVEFDTAIKAGDVASVERAVSLYRGPLLEGCTEEWSFPERREREETCLDALALLAAQSLTQGEYSEAARLLHRAISMDPLRESVHRALLETLAASGDFAAVDRHYRDLRQALHREINAEPAEETVVLYRLLRSRRHALSPSTPSTDVAPLRRLPCPLTRLIGRQDDIESVLALLEQERLVTLTGSGGVGKTRLAIAVAEQVAAGYPDGVWFVDLAPLTDPMFVGQAVASMLGVQEESGRTLNESLTHHLHSRTLLLLLDNCEHLLEACCSLTEALLQACPRLHILATSRERLNLAGEQTYRVPSLSLPDPSRLPSVEDLERYEAVHLFIDRARSARSTFVVTPGSAPALAQLCVRLDGIPLALELAAARVRSLSVEEINARLDERFCLLTGGSRNALPRQQTLRALIDWSYDLLSETEKALLRRLSVFVGGWTLEAAEKVCAGEEIDEWELLNMLTALVDKNLVVYEEQHEEARYRLLETVRQYVQNRLQENVAVDAVRTLHLNYYLRVAEETETKLRGPDQVAVLARLEAEHDNLRAALDYCKEAGYGEIGLRLAGAVWRFWYTHGHAPEGRQRLMDALACSGASAPTELRAKALNGLAGMVLFLGDYATAQALLGESLVIRRALEDVSGVAIALNNLGIIAQRLGDADATASRYEEALAISRDHGDVKMVAEILGNLGYAAFSQRDYLAARAYNEECLVLSRQLGDMVGTAIALDNLGDVARVSGEYAQAHSYHAEALTIAAAIGDQRLVAQCLEGLGRLAIEQGSADRAVRLFAFENNLRQTLSSPQPDAEQQQQDGYIVEARSALTLERFEQARSEGIVMSLEQVIQYALDMYRA